MTTPDIALAFNPTIRSGTGGVGGEICGPSVVDGNRIGCVAKGVTLSEEGSELLKICEKFASDNDLFLFKFAKAFARMSVIGFAGAEKLQSIRKNELSNKLGVVSELDLSRC